MNSKEYIIFGNVEFSSVGRRFNIDLDQFDTYVSIFLNRFEESYKTIFKQLDIKPEEFQGVEYLFVPGKKGESALVAAKEAYKKVLNKNETIEDLFLRKKIVFKYLDFDNKVKIFNPLNLK